MTDLEQLERNIRDLTRLRSDRELINAQIDELSHENQRLTQRVRAGLHQIGKQLAVLA